MRIRVDEITIPKPNENIYLHIGSDRLHLKHLKPDGTIDVHIIFVSGALDDFYVHTETG